MCVQFLKNVILEENTTMIFYCWSFIVVIIPASLKVAGCVLYQQNVTVKCCYKFSSEK